MAPHRLLPLVALLGATASLHAQDDIDTSRVPLRMYTQYGIGATWLLAPEGYGSELRMAFPIQPVPGLRLLVTASLIGIPDTTTPIAFQAILGFDLSWHLVRFDRQSSGIYVKAGPALEAMLDTEADELGGDPALDLGAGIQFKVGRRVSLYFDAQYVVGRVDKAELLLGFLYGR